MKPEEIISDDEINTVHANARFEPTTKREVVNFGTLKCACGLYQGYTSKKICQEHGTITKNYRTTKKGRNYLWAVFGDHTKV